MTFTGWIVDIGPSTRPGRTTLTVSNGSARVKIPLRATYDIYAVPKTERLAAMLADHPGFVDVTAEDWFSPPWYDKTIKVLRASFADIESAAVAERRIIKLGLGEVYNRFPDPFTKLCIKLKLPPTSKVRVKEESSNLELAEDPDKVDYEEPGYSYAEFRFFDWFGETVYSKDPLGRLDSGRISYDLRIWKPVIGQTSYSGTLSTLDSIAEELSSVDAIRFPPAFGRALTEAGIELDTIPLKIARTCPNSPSLRAELIKLVEWSRISYMPLRELAEASIGKPLTSNEAKLAFEWRYLIPESHPRLESWKTIKEVISHDRGGTLFRPEAGVYFGVAQLDFISMYPKLISSWNISPETVNPPNFIEKLKPVPITKHLVSEKRGLVAEAMEGVIRRREETKRLEHGPNPLRQAAIKWLLVASFGYLGYRNAKFGKLEAYECVTSLSRAYMGKAIEAAEKMGFRVLHTMVDSLFVQKPGASESEFQKLADSIEKETNLPIKIDAFYDWVVLTNNKGSSLGSPSRYFGRLKGGKLKIKGIDYVKRDTPGIVRSTQWEAIKFLKQAGSEDSFSIQLAKALATFDHTIERVLRNQVEPEELVFSLRRGLRAGLGEAAERENEGYTPVVQAIQGSRLYLAEEGFSGFDQGHYIRLLERAKEQISPRNKSLWAKKPPSRR